MIENSSQKVLLLGSSGLLGCTLAPFLVSRGYIVYTNSRSKVAQYKLDFTLKNEVFDFLETIKPEVIVNLIGLTDVDYCEKNPNQAYLVNVKTVENIVHWMTRSKTKCHLVHISTDQMYDGFEQQTEEQVRLTNFYAFSKYAGELEATKVTSTILRTNFFGRSHCENRNSMTDWLFCSLSKNEPIQVFTDILFSPLSMNTLSKIILECIRKKIVGVFNAGSHFGMSKSDFSFYFASALKLQTGTMKSTTSEQVTFLKTYRPKDMRMCSFRLEHALGIKLPNLKNEINHVAKEYLENT